MRVRCMPLLGSDTALNSAVRVKAPPAATSKLRNTLPPLAPNDLLGTPNDISGRVLFFVDYVTVFVIAGHLRATCTEIIPALLASLVQADVRKTKRLALSAEGSVMTNHGNFRVFTNPLARRKIVFREVGWHWRNIRRLLTLDELLSRVLLVFTHK